MGHAFGFAQGFDVYDNSFARFDVPGALVTQRALEWLAEVPPGERFFLYLHYIDAHHPYGTLTPEEVYAASPRLQADARPVPPLALEALADLRTPEQSRLLLATGARPSIALLELAYDRGVGEFDRTFGDLLTGLRARADWPRTALIATSDHGEAFYERGYGNHARALYDDELAIPLALRLPGVSAERGVSSCDVGLVDLLPTLCSAQALACPEVDGRSLFDAESPRALLAEGVPGLPAHRAARSGRFKLIYQPAGPLGADLARDTERGRTHPYSLYDLEADPGERHDLLAQTPLPAQAQAAFERLRDELERAAGTAALTPIERAPIDAETERRLESLGYLEPEGS
jgi:arylsulfatase A-like enzyme